MKQINSTQNPLIKEIFQLQEKSRVRKKVGLFVIEGNREIEIALKSGYVLKQILVCFDLFTQEQFQSFKKSISSETE
ncbi:MAG: RNA methyltransferase, partial [Myroides sp.]|nr:RNA methyltransferase [Myroides sp.]